MDKKANSSNHDRVSQNSNTDQQADRVGQVTRVSPNSSRDQRIDQVSWVNWVSRVDNTKQKKEVPVMLLTRRAGLQRIRLT
jgi:hypothetical protein